MKKLILITASVMIAGLTQAATVNWNSGALKRADGADGGWGSSTINDSHVTALAVKVFLVDEGTYNAKVSLSQKDLYAEYKDVTTPEPLPSVSTGYAIKGVQDTDTEIGTSYYAVVLYTYTDTEYGDMYMATTATIDGTKITKAANTYDVDNIGTGVTEGWQAVPEPTSGLLLLVGGALLALKRKGA